MTKREIHYKQEKYVRRDRHGYRPTTNHELTKRIRLLLWDLSAWKNRKASLQSDRSPQLRWLRGVCDISPAATFCCLALAQWQRWQAADFWCHKKLSVAWVCVKTWTPLGRSGF